jgi:glycosyltransferase involved in cell wall biosynthesis
MRILVIAPFVPWPLVHGGRIRLFHLVRAMAREHEVTLVALANGDEKDFGPLAAVCTVVPVPYTYRPVAAFCRFMTGPNPYNVERFASGDQVATVSRLVADTRFDVVHIETTHLWPVARACGDIPVVLGTQNVESSILAQLERVCRNPLKRLLYGREIARMRRFEEDAWRRSSCCLAVSDEERTEIMAAGVDQARVVTVPNGVDLERFAFTSRPGGRRLLFLGGVDYLPNRDALDWLLAEVWPLVRALEPAAELLVAGRGVGRLADAGLPAGVTSLGDPTDVPACFATADGLLVPLRVGGGTRLKVLEAMAAGLPVVTTARGCEGLAVRDNEQLLIADTPQQFSEAAARLLQDRQLSARLAASARRLVEERYDWQVLAQQVVGVIEGIVSRPGNVTVEG